MDLVPAIQQLANLYGVQTAYYDVSGNYQLASTDALVSVLRSLGAPLVTLEDVTFALRERQQTLWQRSLEPVIVAWDGNLSAISLRLPSPLADVSFDCHLELETGESQSLICQGKDLPIIESAEIEGTKYVKKLTIAAKLPLGYHHLTLELPGKPQKALIISAPTSAYIPEDSDKRMWGVFLPLYSLHTHKSWGCGDFSDLEALINWVSTLGGSSVATLPFLATFLDDGIFCPSPYLPISRRLWNEFYLDLTAIPELQKCPLAQSLLTSTSFLKEINNLRNSPLVDYKNQMALKRHVLEELCQCLFAEESERLNSLRLYAQNNPVVEEYARFRATGEKQRSPWYDWPETLRNGVLKEGDYDEKDWRYHLYAQWLTDQQVQHLSDTARAKNVKLYLDLPLGVHPDGYDVWRERNIFATDVSVGAPPDVVFTRGQNWTFPPLQPDKIREDGYQHVIAYLHHHLRHAGVLRIDHVMSLHRLFWLPKDLEASQGVYVRYQADELYAILALESYRHKSMIAGEDLGTVPAEVRPAMAQHGLHNMYVLYYELAENPQEALRQIPHNSVASLNTHDMPPFAAFWHGTDLQEFLKYNLLDTAGVEAKQRNREAIKNALISFFQQRGWLKQINADTPAALKACLSFLAASPARITLINLEDLWLETHSQNIPGSRENHPNWRHKARYDFETLCQMPQVLDTLKDIDRLRKHK